MGSEALPLQEAYLLGCAQDPIKCSGEMVAPEDVGALTAHFTGL